MATYAEIYSLWVDSALRNRVSVAITIAADSIRAGTDTGADFAQSAGAHDARYAWVKNNNIFTPAPAVIQAFWNAMLAANSSLSVSEIQGASDAAIQSNVNKVVDVLAKGSV